MGHEPVRRAVAARDRFFFEPLPVGHLPSLCDETVKNINIGNEEGKGKEGKGRERGGEGRSEGSD